MPFVTEELWQRLPKAEGAQPESIMLATYPEPQEEWRCLALEEEMDFLLEIVKVVRSLRAGNSTTHTNTLWSNFLTFLELFLQA